MIILERLAITRFKGVRAVALDLPERGSILIEGNNEAGKSTLFEAIHFALYGRTLAGTLADAVPHDATDVEVSIRVRIDRPGEVPDLLDISRSIRSGATQAVAGVRLRVVRGGVEAEEVTRIVDANRRIELELGGLTADTFVNSCFVPQKQLAGLETLDRSQREAAVARLLNLDRLTHVAQSFAIRPAETEELRRHEARVALARGTDLLAATEARRTIAEVNVRRFDVLDALEAFEKASDREREAKAVIDDTMVRRRDANEVVEANTRAENAHAAWMAVARAIHAANEARVTARRSRTRRADALMARDALPAADARLERIRAIDSEVATVTSWLAEGRPALRQEVLAIEARRQARSRLTAELEAVTEQLAAIERDARALEARRATLQPRIAARDAARARRAAIDALREAVAVREACRREANDVDAAVVARVRADEDVATALVRVAETSARLALLERDRDAVARREHLAAVRRALANALDARDIHRQARARNDRLRDLTLGVLDATPNIPGGLALRLLVDHPETGTRVIDLAVGTDSEISASNRPATTDERRHAQHGEIPTLAPTDLDALDREANQARDALEPLGEAPPTTTRGARDRLAELDAILAAPAPSFDATAYAEATTEHARAATEARVCQSVADAMASPDTLARRAAQAKAQAAEAVALVADQSTALGLRLSDETGAANQSLADARRSADDTLEATAEAVGTLHATSREEESLVRRRVPLENRARSARDDLASDDDATLTRADEAARTSGRSGDGIAVTAWHAATTEARILGVGAADVTGEALPPRDAVTAFADAVRQASREANDEVAQLRIRVGELPSATADTDRDAELEKRALDTFRLAVRAAHDASTQAREALAGHLVQGFADAIHRAATIADDFVVAVSTDDAEALPTEHGAHEVADAFASAARLTHVDTAWRTIEDLIATEREADRARAVAQSDAETAWRTAAEAAVLLGVDIGDRPDDVGEFAPLSRLAGERLGVGVVGVATTRAMAVGAWEAVIADVGAATETIAAARRTLGDEAALPLAEALSRRDDARLDHRARERAATILTTTRSRMMAAILPDTQREMARLLPDLTAGRYRFPRLDERFQLEVFDERKRGWVRRSLFSGGTQDQFSLALRLGFAIAALPRELGTAPGFLFLDEPLSSFDRERTHALVDLLRDPTGIIGTHFRQIFLISHSQAFDPGLFTHHIEMEEGRVARTTLSATAPAVTA